MKVIKKYEILLEQSAEKDLRKLPKNIFYQIIAKIKLLSENPRPDGVKKLINLSNYWRIRIGSFRVIYEINDPEKFIKVYKIKHRKDVYK